MRHSLVLAVLLSIQSAAAWSAGTNKAAIDQAVSAGRLQQASVLYKQLIAQNDKRADIHLDYARFLQNTGQMGLAVREYQRCIELRPDMADAYVALSDISLQTLDVENALAYSQQALKLKPDSLPARTVHVNALMQSGRNAQADTEFSDLLGKSNDPDVLFLAYQIKLRKGDFIEARRYLQQALAARPDQVAWVLDVSKLLESAGDYQASRTYLRNALLKNETSVDARLRLARNLEVFENDYDGAIVEYRKVLDIDPIMPTAVAGIDRCEAKKNDLARRLKLALQHVFAHR